MTCVSLSERVFIKIKQTSRSGSQKGKRCEEKKKQDISGYNEETMKQDISGRRSRTLVDIITTE